jgi:hypothetical protein
MRLNIYSSSTSQTLSQEWVESKRRVNDSGQISLLVLIASIAILSATFLVGVGSDLLIAQQRLNTKADSIALAGAAELEFNQDQACMVAQNFSASNYDLEARCESDLTSIRIELTQENPNPLLGVVFPNIYAISRAGIAID